MNFWPVANLFGWLDTFWAYFGRKYGTKILSLQTSKLCNYTCSKCISPWVQFAPCEFEKESRFGARDGIVTAKFRKSRQSKGKNSRKNDQLELMLINYGNWLWLSLESLNFTINSTHSTNTHSGGLVGRVIVLFTI